MNNIQNEIKKSSKSLDIMFKVLRVAITVSFCIFIVSIIYISCIGVRNVNGITIQSGISIGGNFINNVGDLKANAPELGFILTWMVLLQIIFIRIGDMFHDIRETASPFTEKNVARIRSCFFVLLVAAILPNLVELVISFFVTGSDCDIELVNLVILAIAPVMLSLSKIFSYGMQLQKQDDETL